jgi:hypothetical protein
MVLSGKGCKRLKTRKRRVVDAKARKGGARVGKVGPRSASRPAKVPGKMPDKMPKKMPKKMPNKVARTKHGVEGSKPTFTRLGEARHPERAQELGPDQRTRPEAAEASRTLGMDPVHGQGSRKVGARGVSVISGVLRSGREISASASPERPQVGPATIVGGLVGGRVGAVLGSDGSSLPVPIASFLI